MVWGWLWGDLGVFSGWFRTDFEKSKNWRSRIEKLSLNGPEMTHIWWIFQIHFPIYSYYCWRNKLSNALVRKDHAGGKRSYAVGKGSCWWRRIMCWWDISSWWQRIMWVVEDVDYCKFIILLHKISFFAQNGSPCVRSQHKLQQTICRLAVYLFELKFRRETGPM